VNNTYTPPPPSTHTHTTLLGWGWGDRIGRGWATVNRYMEYTVQQGHVPNKPYAKQTMAKLNQTKLNAVNRYTVRRGHVPNEPLATAPQLMLHRTSSANPLT
jgi:hypothetical protein